MSSSKKNDLKRDFAAGVYLSEAKRVEPERRLERHQFTKLGRKYQHD